MVQRKTETQKEDIREFSDEELYLRFEHTMHLQQTWKSCINSVDYSLIDITINEIFIYNDKQYDFLHSKFLQHINGLNF